MPKSKWLRHKIILRRHLSLKYAKNAQILVSDFGKLQDRKKLSLPLQLQFYGSYLGMHLAYSQVS